MHAARWSRIPAAAAALLLACGSGDDGDRAAVRRGSDGWWNDRVVYEIFVRSFADSDGDGVGDLRGAAAHLEALNDGDPATTRDLGVGAIWLMPVFPSPSYHGYDVTDYTAVHPDYGTLADLDAFVAEAHRRGIKVLLDMVLNHASRRHPWFLDSQAGEGSSRRDWFVWSPTYLQWYSPWGSGTWHSAGDSWYYGLFDAAMPDLNLANPEVEAELVGAMKFWLARGVDGFRLDAVRYFFENGPSAIADQPETHAFLRRLRAALAEDYPDALLVGEAWSSLQSTATYYGDGDEVHLAFAFELAEALKGAAMAGDATALRSLVGRTEDAYRERDRAFQAPFLSNHDQLRTMRAVGGDPGAARAAAAALFALPGTPFLYYGEELGMQGGALADDRYKRTPFRWTSEAGHGFTSGSAWFDAPEAAGVDLASQRDDPASLWNLYRRLIAARTGSRALTRGDVNRPATTAGPGVFAIERGTAEERVLAVVNFGPEPAAAFDVAVAGTPTVLEAEGLAADPIAADGVVRFPSGLAARSFTYLTLD